MTAQNTDIFGFEVEVGDKVAYNPAKYKGVTTGIVKKLTPKGFSIAQIFSNGEVSDNTFNTSSVVLDLTGIYKREIMANPGIKEMVRKQLEESRPDLYI